MASAALGIRAKPTDAARTPDDIPRSTARRSSAVMGDSLASDRSLLGCRDGFRQRGFGTDETRPDPGQPAFDRSHQTRDPPMVQL